MNYEQYHKKGGTYELPVEVFDNLLDEKEELEKKNRQLKGSLQTHEILLRVYVEENQKLKEKLQQKEDIINDVELKNKEVNMVSKKCDFCHKTIPSTKNSYHIYIHEQADKFGGNTLQGCTNMLYQNTINCCANCMCEIREFILSLINEDDKYE